MLMVWLATCLLLSNVTFSNVLLFIGSMFFAYSDSILAWGKFVKKGVINQILVMLTYYVAQTLIALSIFLLQ